MAAIAATPVAMGLAGVSAVTNLAGGYLEAQDLKRQGKANAAAAELNAAQLFENAAQARAKGEADARTSWNESLKDIGQMRALFGASGVDFTGSPLDVIESDTYVAQADAFNLKYQGELKAQAFEREAQLEQQRAVNVRKSAKASARSALLMGVGRAAGSISGRLT